MIRLRVPERILLYGIWAGFVLILLTPLVVTPQTVFPYVVGKALYSRAIIEIVFALWILLVLLDSSYRPPRSRLLLLLVISLGVAVLAAYSGVGLERSLWSTYERMQGVVDMAHWFVLAVVLASTVRTIRNWRILLNLNLSVSLMIALLTIAQYYSVNIPALSDQWVISDGLRPGVDWHGRAFATLGNAIYLGTYMTVNCMIALGFLIRSLTLVASPPPPPPPRGVRRWRHGKRRTSPRKQTSLPTGKSGLSVLWLGRLFWGGTALLDLWVIRLSGSRGALLGLFAGIGFVVIAYMFLRRARIARFTSFGSMSLLAGALMLSVAFLFRSDTALFDDSFLNSLANRQTPRAIDSARESVLNRTLVLKMAFSGFADRPVLGWGPENFVAVFGRYAPSESDYGKIDVHGYAHSKFAEELVTKGLIGLLIYLSIWALMFLIVVRTARSVDSRGQAPVLFIGGALMGSFLQNQFLFDTATGSLQHILLLALVVHFEVARRDAAPVQGQGVRFWRNGARAVMATGAMILVAAGLFANHATYLAASDIVRVARQSNTPEQIREYLVEAIAGFEPLAHVPRIMLFHSTGLHWAVLRTRPRAEVRRTLALIDAEAAAAVESEPENWRIHEVLARLYDVVASDGYPEYHAVVNHHLERLSELAPNRLPTR